MNPCRILDVLNVYPILHLDWGIWITLLLAIGVFFTLMLLIERTQKIEFPPSEPIPPIIGEKKNDRRRRIFENYSNQNNQYSDDAVCSVVALFSLIIQRDGDIDPREIKVANLYFLKHPQYNVILSYSKQKPSRKCDELLKMYNACPELAHYKQYCKKILARGIYYEAALDLLTALFQVAYSSDGVIGSEMEILDEIAYGLGIMREDWTVLNQKYSTYTGPKKRDRKKETDKTDPDPHTEKNNSSQEHEKAKTREKDNRTKEESQKESSEQQEQKQERKKKSSTYGYRITQAYNQLGLLSTASEAEIKNAYRKLAKKYHPDRLSPDATDLDRKISADQFRQIKEAYDLIRLEKGRR